MGYTDKHISLLINGKAAITEDAAFKLERVTGMPAGFWLSREVQYREAIARVDEERVLQGEASWLNELPLRHMIQNGWVREFRAPGAQVAECLRFFGVASTNAWRSSYQEPIAAFRASRRFSIDSAATATWLRQGERAASSIDIRPYDKTRFRASLTSIKELVNEPDPRVFVPRLVEVCSQAGVAVVFESAPKGCPVSGATKWLSPRKALLMLSLRHKSNDHLWFSFFHEAGHLLLHGKRMMFIDIEGKLKDEQEEEANEFARETLIPSAFNQTLASLAPNESAVLWFAQTVGIAPGIVVGRMQNEGLLSWNKLNHLKVRYTFEANRRS
jgi:hypothetical protein